MAPMKKSRITLIHATPGAIERIASRRGRSVFTSPYSAVARLKQLLAS